MNERQETQRFEGENQNLIKTQYFDIDAAEIRDNLSRVEDSSPNRYGLIRLGDKDVPEFIDLIELTYKRPEDMHYDSIDCEAAYHVHGTVEFDPSVVEHHSDWTIGYLSNLDWQLSSKNYEVSRLRHDVNAIYVSIGDTRYFRVAANSEHDLCSINTSVVDDIYPDDKDEMIERIDQSEAVERTTELFGRSLDCFVACFSEEGSIDRRYALTGYKDVATFSYETSKDIGRVATSTALEIIDKPDKELASAKKSGLDSIGGLFAVKNRLRQISDNLSDPEAAAMYGISPTHFILYGEPGTGKTSLVEAFAEESGATVKRISVADISHKWIGSSARNIKKAFEDLINLEGDTKVLFIDEIDSIIGNQASGSNPTEAKREFLQRLNDLSQNHPNIIVAGATNFMPDDLDPAFVRSGRFEAIGINLPTPEERIDIWMTLIAQSGMKLNPLWKNHPEKSLYQTIGLSEEGELMDSYDYEALSNMTEGWSGADMAKALENARMVCYEKYKQTGRHCNLSNDILVNSVRMLRRS